MNIKRIVLILLGVMLIGFGVGIYSLLYNDEFKFSNINLGSNIIVNSKDSNVKVGLDGIEVKDGDDHVIVNWDGIKVTDGDDKVIVGPDGIDNDDSSHSSDWNWSFGNWFGSHNLIEETINEERLESINEIDTINVSSSFVDIKVITENRDDVRIKYRGRIKANVIPELKTEKIGNELNIKLVNEGNSYTVTESNVVLEVFIPKSFEGDYNISSSSAEIYANDIVSKDFKISTSSGDVSLGLIKANNISLSTSSGDIVSQEIYGNVNVNTSSGDVSFKINGSTGDFNITTSSGDVDFKYGYDSNYIGIVNTSSGDFEYEGTIKVTKQGRNNYDFMIGNGNKNININTSSGDINIVER